MSTISFSRLIFLNRINLIFFCFSMILRQSFNFVLSSTSQALGLQACATVPCFVKSRRLTPGFPHASQALCHLNHIPSVVWTNSSTVWVDAVRAGLAPASESEIDTADFSERPEMHSSGPVKNFVRMLRQFFFKCPSC